MREITGGIFTDSRGTIKHVNDFTFQGVERFYTIYHPNTEVIRAWQGHRVETKWFYVIQGSFKLQWIKIDDWDSSGKNLIPESLILTAQESKLIKIGPGYANGIKALEPDSIIMLFSDKSVEESKKDDYRWGVDYFVRAEW